MCGATSYELLLELFLQPEYSGVALVQTQENRQCFVGRINFY